MKAWQFTNTHEPLVLADVDEPRPGPDEVLIDIKSAGICHSDVGLLEDETWLQALAKLCRSETSSGAFSGHDASRRTAMRLS